MSLCLLLCIACSGENSRVGTQERGASRAKGRRGTPMHLPLNCCAPISPQNNQLEKIYPEELARLQRLETLNLQNNRLTSRGEGTSPEPGHLLRGLGHGGGCLRGLRGMVVMEKTHLGEPGVRGGRL